jgi:hypothetical protein
VEFDALTQFEAPDGRARLRPLGGERGRQAHGLVALDQRLVDVAGEAELQAFVERMRIHRLHVALIGNTQGHGVGGKGGERKGGSQNGRNEFFH